MTKQIIGFFISNDFCVCSDPTRYPKSNKGEDILRWLSTFSDSINIIYDLNWAVAAILRRLNLKEKQLRTLLEVTKLWIEPDFQLSLINDKFFSVRYGRQYDAPYAQFANGANYSQPEYIEGDEAYCRKKADEIQKVGCEVYQALCKFNFIPDSIVAPASQFAKHVLHRFKFPTVDDMPVKVGEVAYESFDAGIFETYKKGTFNEVWDYDISSAYMKSLSTCPDTRLGTFKEVKTLGDTPLGFYRGLVTIYPNANMHPVGYPMGEGDDKVNLTPSGTWSRSVPRSYIDYLIKHKKGEFEVKWGVEWQPKELKFIYAPLMKRIYEMKQESQGICRNVMKTVGLSIWGKQGELRNEKFGEFFNPIPYTFGASNTRITVLEVCEQNNTIPIGIQVDGICSEKPLEYLNFGDGLGQWKLSHKKKPCIAVNADIIAIQGKTNNQPFSVDYDAFKRQIEQDPDTNLYNMTANMPVTLGKSLNANDIEHLGDIRPTTRTIDVALETKRLFKDMPQTGRELISGKHFDSIPLPIEMLELASLPKVDREEEDLTDLT